jgi:hypothetical protein
LEIWGLIVASALLAEGHPYKTIPPNDPGFRPEFLGGPVIDPYDFATITASGSAPDESVSRATERTVASVADKYLSGTVNVAGTVTHKRAPEDPIRAIDDSRGRRTLSFQGGGYISIPRKQKRGISFSTSTAARPLDGLLAIKLTADATRTGDGTIFDCGGYRLAVGADLRDLTWTAPRASVAYSKTFADALPTPVEGQHRCWLQVIWDAATPSLTLKIDGDTIEGSETAGSGAFTAVGASDLTIGGRSGGNGLDFELDGACFYMGADKTEDIADWWCQRNPLGYGSAARVTLPGLDTISDRLYNTLLGEGNAGLTISEITATSDLASPEPGSWGAISGSKNILALWRTSGIIQRRAGASAWNRRQPWMFMTGLAAPGPVGFERAEFRITFEDNPPTNAAKFNWVEHAYFAWGAGDFSVEAGNEGTPLWWLGPTGVALADNDFPLFGGTGRHITSIFSGDNALSIYRQVFQIGLEDVLMLAPIVKNNHSESPNHNFGLQTGNSSDRTGVCRLTSLGHNQRMPIATGSQGGEAEQTHNRIESICSWIIPANIGQNFGGVVVGQPNNNPGANTGSGKITISRVVMEPGGRALGLLSFNVSQEPNGADPDESSYYGSCNHIDAPATLEQASASGKARSYPEYGTGQGPHPIRRDTIKALNKDWAGANPRNRPAFIRNLIARYEAQEAVRFDRLEVVEDTDTEKSPDNFSLAGATAGDPEWTPTVRSWADIPNGSEWEAALGTKKTIDWTWPRYMALRDAYE